MNWRTSAPPFDPLDLAIVIARNLGYLLTIGGTNPKLGPAMKVQACARIT
jgi:hypothetical protein